ncbi:MAG: transketolase [Campylobacteraceae bacterium]|jgi:transketolase|nr:transketolase [Campylobacteraceae bacterium]MBT3882211.1 transketolase [Campylobacteraceae bacterium]MBT4030635.1 transketolase [Campylobacteraceae bacterium]MBT4178785.1 transketolase [Campylobacteraceae bacterium]MBT4571950.1 transketolase [Campylobacteraceae bacterium]
MSNTLLQKQADTIRFLAADMVQKANSGHPGAPMGMADIVTVLSKHLKLDPANSSWLNRDRLVFSGGHASSMVYSLLHLWGFNVTIEDIKQFRQTGSKTPGHPEFGHTHGVEITTGPLGQGIANAVGFAMASKYASFSLNTQHTDVIDHHVYCLCGDGDLQEGISYEALSTAGHQNLSNMTLIYDSNDITIEGDISIAWSEDVKTRFEAINFDVITIDGHDFDAIENALTSSRTSSNPTLIIAKTAIGKGAATMEGSHHTHGAPLGNDELAASKAKAGFNPEESFVVPAEVKAAFDKTETGALQSKAWGKLVRKDLPLSEQNETLNALLNPDYSKVQYPDFSETAEIATRDSNHKILNAIAKAVPSFLGGSADLAPSNKTELTGLGDFPKGRNIHFGIKEHSMAAMANAMNLYGLYRVFSATFFIFSDYLKPAARVAALANIPQHFVWTHDSIGVGEDGATHQPIEQLSQFRAIPNFYTFRPADATENVKCWEKALTMSAPTAFVCSRQKLKTLKPTKVHGDVSNGGYLLTQRDDATVTLMASGSEVMLCLQTACVLEDKGIKCNIVSVPCFDLLCEQDKEYIDTIINPSHTVIAVEMATAMEYYKFADHVIGMTGFGESGPANELFEKFGFTKEQLSQNIANYLA